MASTLVLKPTRTYQDAMYDMHEIGVRYLSLTPTAVLGLYVSSLLHVTSQVSRILLLTPFVSVSIFLPFKASNSSYDLSTGALPRASIDLHSGHRSSLRIQHLTSLYLLFGYNMICIQAWRHVGRLCYASRDENIPNIKYKKQPTFRFHRLVWEALSMKRQNAGPFWFSLNRQFCGICIVSSPK